MEDPSSQDLFTAVCIISCSDLLNACDRDGYGFP